MLISVLIGHFTWRFVPVLCSTNKCQSAAEKLALTGRGPILFQQSSRLLSFNHWGPPNLWLSASLEFIWQDNSWGGAELRGPNEPGSGSFLIGGLPDLYWFVFVWIKLCSSRHGPPYTLSLTSRGEKALHTLSFALCRAFRCWRPEKTQKLSWKLTKLNGNRTVDEWQNEKPRY